MVSCMRSVVDFCTLCAVGLCTLSAARVYCTSSAAYCLLHVPRVLRCTLGFKVPGVLLSTVGYSSVLITAEHCVAICASMAHHVVWCSLHLRSAPGNMGLTPASAPRHGCTPAVAQSIAICVHCVCCADHRQCRVTCWWDAVCFPGTAECFIHLSVHVQLAQNVSTGSAAVASKPEQLREMLKKTTVPDLIEKCKAAGISGYANKRREELIDLLLRKRPRLDEQVRFPGIGRLRSARLCALRSVPCGGLPCLRTGVCVRVCVRACVHVFPCVCVCMSACRRRESMQTP